MRNERKEVKHGQEMRISVRESRGRYGWKEEAEEDAWEIQGEEEWETLRGERNGMF